MLRAFVAIELPEPILKRCREIGEQLRDLRLEGRVAKPQSIHLTLKFLGRIEEDRLQELGEILSHTARGFTSFGLRLEGLEVFPHLRRPRVVWVGVRASEELNRLQREVEDRLEEVGFAKEERDFHPHLTLIRLKSQKNVLELVRFLQSEAGNEGLGEIRVDALHLYQSILKPGGAEYRKLLTAQFGA